MRLLTGFTLLILLCSGCSQNTLLTKQDYRASQDDFLRGDNEKAALDFPRRREDGDFITTMEKGYLSLLQGKPQLKGLAKQAALQENQVRYHVSREARTFFYVQTPEDYYPSEHEVIWLHFLLSWGYSLQGKYTDACVEARVASDLLTLPWAPTGHFDDPAMRLFLAGLWTMCGQWREAQVDFRAAWLMDSSLTWAKQLADRDTPPAQLFIVLGGPGPDVVWDPELSANPLRSARQVRFTLRGRKSALSMTDASGALIPAYMSPDASNWYERHIARESELHEMIQDSAYGGKAAASGAKAAAIIVGDTGIGIGEGIVVGALFGLWAIAELDSRSSNANGNTNTTTGSGGQMTAADYKAGALIGAALGGVIGGLGGAAEGFEQGTAEAKKDLDPSLNYRFVRFLPEYLWMGWRDQAGPYPVTASAAHETARVAGPSVVNNGVEVTIAQLPDSRQGSCTYNLDGNQTTLVTEPDAHGDCPKDPVY